MSDARTTTGAGVVRASSSWVMVLVLRLGEIPPAGSCVVGLLLLEVEQGGASDPGVVFVVLLGAAVGGFGAREVVAGFQ